MINIYELVDRINKQDKYEGKLVLSLHLENLDEIYEVEKISDVYYRGLILADIAINNNVLKSVDQLLAFSQSNPKYSSLSRVVRYASEDLAIYVLDKVKDERDNFYGQRELLKDVLMHPRPEIHEIAQKTIDSFIGCWEEYGHDKTKAKVLTFLGEYGSKDIAFNALIESQFIMDPLEYLYVIGYLLHFGREEIRVLAEDFCLKHSNQLPSKYDVLMEWKDPSEIEYLIG